MSATHFRRARAALAACLVAALVYVGGGAGLLRFDLDRLLFPQTPAPGAAAGFREAFRQPGADGNALVVRRFGTGNAGCVVWFPGEQGGIERYASTLFPDIARAGLVVYAVAYPGQDGAPGRARFDEVQALGSRAVATVIGQCGATRTVVSGRSAGGVIAAHAATATHPAGLVLVSTSPSLAAGVRAHLRRHWFTAALAALPIERLVPRDFTLAEAIPSALHVVIFQGGADRLAPLADLAPADSQPTRAAIVEVPDGTHADTLRRAKPALIATMLDMIRGSQAEAAAVGTAN